MHSLYKHIYIDFSFFKDLITDDVHVKYKLPGCSIIFIAILEFQWQKSYEKYDLLIARFYIPSPCTLITA